LILNISVKVLEYFLFRKILTQVTVGETRELSLPLEDSKDKYLNPEFLQI